MLAEACRVPVPGWLDEASRVWSDITPHEPRAAAIPIWRRPWMVVGRDTFTGDVLRRLGVSNVYAATPTATPRSPWAS